MRKSNKSECKIENHLWYKSKLLIIVDLANLWQPLESWRSVLLNFPPKTISLENIYNCFVPISGLNKCLKQIHQESLMNSEHNNWISSAAKNNSSQTAHISCLQILLCSAVNNSSPGCSGLFTPDPPTTGTTCGISRSTLSKQEQLGIN
jgi:hypothetical protein